VTAEAETYDIYQSDLARHQLADDALDYRRSLYTNVKADHPADELTGEPCDCETGGARWEKNGVAARVEWPPRPWIGAPGELAALAPASWRGNADREAGQ
jgi:hypothetical protein